MAGRVRGAPHRAPHRAPQRVGGMLGAGGTCEFSSLTECRRPASTSDTGFCACLRPAARLSRGSNSEPCEDELGAARAREPGCGSKRSHGWRSAADTQRAEARRAEANVRRRARAAPSGAASNGWHPQVENLRPLGDGHGQPRAGIADTIPIAYAIGLPDGEIPQVENLRPLSAALRRRGGGSGGRPGARRADPTRS